MSRHQDLIDLSDCPRLSWDPTEEQAALTRTGEDVDVFELHHTGAPGPATLTFAGKQEWLLSVERYHEVNKGWSDIFYHVFVFADGEIWMGRDLRRTSQANLADAVTVHIPGNSPIVTEAQHESLLRIARWATSVPANIRGHRQRPASTTCPGDSGIAEVKRLREELAMPIDHNHKYHNLAHLQDAKDAKANGLWDGSDPDMAASRSTVAVIAQRALQKANTAVVSGPPGKDGVSPQMDDIVDAVLSELRRRMRS